MKVPVDASRAKEIKTQSAVIYDTKKEAEMRIDETPRLGKSNITTFWVELVHKQQIVNEKRVP